MPGDGDPEEQLRDYKDSLVQGLAPSAIAAWLEKIVDTANALCGGSSAIRYERDDGYLGEIVAPTNEDAILSLVGGTAEDALKYTKQMREITMTSNDTFLIPIFDFQGTGTGIDIRKVVKTGILPVIDTAIAHKEPRIGMIGAGLVNPPMEAFKGALREFARKYKL